MTTTHRPQYSPTTQDLLDAFTEEMTLAGGTVTDPYDDGRNLIARAVLPASAEIRVNDKVNAGVAIRAFRNEVVVYPYTFRQVCTNGAIAIQALQSRQFSRVQTQFASPSYEREVVLANLREAIRECASPEAFAAATSDMQAAASTEGSWAFPLLTHVARRQRVAIRASVAAIMERYRAAGDRSAFGVMNAVTSLARDTEDPETRWNLEAVGGEFPAVVRRLASRPLTRSAEVETETLTGAL